MPTAETTLARQRYKQLMDDVSAILFRHDPIGLNFEENTDEYDFEAGLILPGLSTCAAADDALQIVFAEFQRCFGQEVAGPITRYHDVARDIWARWQRSVSSHEIITKKRS